MGGSGYPPALYGRAVGAKRFISHLDAVAEGLRWLCLSFSLPLEGRLRAGKLAHRAGLSQAAGASLPTVPLAASVRLRTTPARRSLTRGWAGSQGSNRPAWTGPRCPWRIHGTLPGLVGEGESEQLGCPCAMPRTLCRHWFNAATSLKYALAASRPRGQLDRRASLRGAELTSVRGRGPSSD